MINMINQTYVLCNLRELVQLIKHMYCVISSACTINQIYVLCNLECMYDKSNICIV